MRKALIIACVISIFATGAVLRSRELFQLWSRLHKAWGGAMYGNIARNR